ncbi:hypothetical protein C4577_06175 [Candidatus Parcubacteria bacterium]|nr:MAG: hypothetical protein C4577_06175 [Candidatus Parcubacteria bacterium]
MNKSLTIIKKFIAKHKYQIIFVSIFLLHLFLRFYQLEERTPFNWDQVDNAWAAKNIIVDHKFPLVGMQAKLNSGIYIGPLYYYYVSIFYFITNLDPIASGVIAGITSIFTFFILFLITKKIFDYKTALIAIFINTVSYHIIASDRVQWPVGFIVPISLIIFYSLYKILTGNEKYFVLLGVTLGLSFNIHFTSVFYPIIILLTLPFFPRTKEALKFLLLSIIVFIPFIIPQLITLLSFSSGKTLVSYTNSNYHGFHLVRFFQVAKDAFIEFEAVLLSKISFSALLEPTKYFFLPLFILIMIFKEYTRERIILVYLSLLWFMIPWLVFSIYSGEISNYYFYITRPIVILVISFITMKLFLLKNIYLNLIISMLVIVYSFINLQNFMIGNNYKESLKYYKNRTWKAIKEKRPIEFKEGVPDSYIYYIYKQR